MSDTHYEKYEALAHRLGVEALHKLVPATKERILEALAAGDEHLNTIPLAAWDKAAGFDWRKPWLRNDSNAIQTSMQVTARQAPWNRAPGLSLAERVCVLKHVAEHHMGGADAP